MQEKLYKKIKKGIYTVAGIGLASIFLTTGAFAQKGTIDDTVNGEISNQPGISDKIEEIEQPEYLKELSDKINLDIHEDLANRLEIGGMPAYKEIINGHEIYYFDGLDCALLKLKLGKDISPTLIASVNYAIKEGYEEVKSIIKYSPEFMKIYMNVFKKTLETKGENTYCYVPTNIKNTKSSAQNKEE